MESVICNFYLSVVARIGMSPEEKSNKKKCNYNMVWDGGVCSRKKEPAIKLYVHQITTERNTKEAGIRRTGLTGRCNLLALNESFSPLASHIYAAYTQFVVSAFVFVLLRACTWHLRMHICGWVCAFNIS